jgi:hypothetical protein
MTVREQFNIRTKHLWIALPISILLIVLLLTLMEYFWWLLGVVIIVGSPMGFIIYLKTLCPSCNNSLRELTQAGIFRLYRLPDKVKYCPYCGIDFDEEIDQTQSGELDAAGNSNKGE